MSAQEAMTRMDGQSHRATHDATSPPKSQFAEVGFKLKLWFGDRVERYKIVIVTWERECYINAILSEVPMKCHLSSQKRGTFSRSHRDQASIRKTARSFFFLTSATVVWFSTSLSYVFNARLFIG